MDPVIQKMNEAMIAIQAALHLLDRQTSHKGVQTRGQTEAALEALRRAKGFYQATSSGVIPAIKFDSDK